jgi:DNA-binding GntR family transcriptional regulator
VATHRQITQEIAAGRAAEAEELARAHLSATQRFILREFETGVVDVSSIQARRAITLNRPGNY